jgi:hypothetical protein
MGRNCRMGVNAIYSGRDGLPAAGHHPPPIWRPCVFIIPRNCRGVAFGPRAGSVDYFIKKRYASIRSPVHVLAFYLDLSFFGCRDASRTSSIKPFVESDASECARSTRRLLRHAPPAKQAACIAQMTHVVMGTVPYLSSTGAYSDWGTVDTVTLSLPHVWLHLHADGAPTLLRDLAAQVFSLVPTSATGERSFKQRSRVHTIIRNRLSEGKADMTQAIIFNQQQKKRFAEGALLPPPSPAAQRWRSRSCTPSTAGNRRLCL